MERLGLAIILPTKVPSEGIRTHAQTAKSKPCLINSNVLHFSTNTSQSQMWCACGQCNHQPVSACLGGTSSGRCRFPRAHPLLPLLLLRAHEEEAASLGVNKPRPDNNPTSPTTTRGASFSSGRVRLLCFAQPGQVYRPGAANSCAPVMVDPFDPPASRTAATDKA